jgi:hypothetical protein
MSLLDDAHRFLTATYETASDALADMVTYLPATIADGARTHNPDELINAFFTLEGVGTDFGPAAALAVLVGAAKLFGSGTASTLNTSLNANVEDNAMTQLVIPNCFQVTIQMTAGGHAVENVVGVQNAGGTAAGAAAAVLAAWKVASGPLSQLSSLVAMVGVRAVDIGSTNGAIVFVADTTLGGKTTTNALATRGACALLQWNGGTRSRSSRGRLYYGPIMEQDIQNDGATLVVLNQGNFSTAFSNFRTSLSGGGYPLVVLSRTLSTAFAVSAHAVESTIATQRRRIR